jgi:signal transduction histidine kinase/CheY-like chemotaxis protein
MAERDDDSSEPGTDLHPLRVPDPGNTGVGPPPPEKRPTGEYEVQPVGADLFVLTGVLAGTRHSVDKEVIIGRESDATIHVPGSDVSRRHARIRRTPADDYVIEDLHSRNGTLVNGIPVELHMLSFGDKIQIGAKTLFVFTHHHALEEQLVRWQRIELVSHLTAGLVHDFDNYMAVLLGYIQYVDIVLTSQHSLDELRDCIRECLPIMESAAREGANLTRKVLTFARGASRQNVTVDLSQIAEEAVLLVKTNLGSSIQITRSLKACLPVRGDRTELMQVLVNLFFNARDAMPSGGTLTVEGELLDLSTEEALRLELPFAGPHVALRVRDTGTGIPDEIRKRIFEPLFTTKGAGKSTGLGLSTVSRIVESHQGHVRVESSVGAGSCFSLFFPVAEGEHQKARSRTTLILEQPIYPGQGSTAARSGVEETGVILLLDVGEILRQRAVRALCSQGYELVLAKNSEEALSIFQQLHGRVRLVVVNLDAPAMEALTTCQRIAAIDPDVKVLAASTRELDEATEGIEKIGIRYLVRTTCDTQAFSRAVLDALAF